MILYMYFGRVGVLTISLGFLMGDRAEERFPELQRQLEACLRDGTPLGSEFDANFE